MLRIKVTAALRFQDEYIGNTTSAVQMKMRSATNLANTFW